MTHRSPAAKTSTHDAGKRTAARSALVAALLATVAIVAACGSDSPSEPANPPGSGNFGPGGSPPPSSGVYTVTGRATYTAVPGTTAGGLNYGSAAAKPIRGARVELVDSAGNRLGNGTTDASGNYTFGGAQTSTSVRVIVYAEFAGTGFSFKVKDNTDNDLLYGMASAAVAAPTEGSTTTVNLHAPSGWGGSSYTADRVAAPFSILDVAYQAMTRVRSVSSVALPALNIFWSPNNRPVDGTLAAGDIGTSFFWAPASTGPAMYILGAAGVDTDEYDTAVVAHEIGHFLQHAVSRDDSRGGEHFDGDRLDMRVAFSEGWGNAWSAMARDDTLYFDSAGAAQSAGFAYRIDVVPSAPSAIGWYSESSVEYLLYQSYADASIGFGGIYSALAGMKTSPAFNSIFSFNHYLSQARPTAASTIMARAATQNVNGTGQYGEGETNNGGLTAALPVYRIHNAPPGSPREYCVRSTLGAYNKHGTATFVRFTTNGGSTTIALNRTSSTNATTFPDFQVTASDGTQASAISSVAGTVSRAVSLPAGEHTLAITDFNQSETAGLTSCFNLTIN